MKILSTDDIRRIDRVTIEQEGVDSLDLIARVADGVASDILAQYPSTTPVTVFAGPGNNGADALAVAQRLLEAGFKPYVCLFNIGGHSLSPECRACRDSLLAAGCDSVYEIVDSFQFPVLSSESLVVDGMFGTGLRDPLTGGYTTVVRQINESGATVVSIDMPSGLFGDWNSGVLSRDVVHASVTYAIQFPRLAFFVPDNEPMVGRVKLLDIGLSQRAYQEAESKYYAVEAQDVAMVVRRRRRYASKADFGHALLFAGCYGMMGAAVMSALGALRSGVGKLTVHSARCGFPVLQGQVPEALFSPDHHEILISDMTLRHPYDGIGVGPGLGTNDTTRGAFETLIKTIRRPMVIDADALNILSRTPGLAEHLTPYSILTPHAGEFDRLFGEQPSAEARLLKAIEMSRRLKVIIVLKGANTAVVRPDDTVFFNTSGTPALATPGSGDVLTGVLTGLLAQGYTPDVAAIIGVFVHGLAGEIAARRHGTYGVLATDVAANIGAAFNEIMGE